MLWPIVTYYFISAFNSYSYYIFSIDVIFSLILKKRVVEIKFLSISLLL